VSESDLFGLDWSKAGGNPVARHTDLYPVGTRVLLVRTTDEYTRLQPGATGTVNFIDDLGTIHVRWDDGSSLGIVPAFGDVISKEEEGYDERDRSVAHAQVCERRPEHSWRGCPDYGWDEHGIYLREERT
jgi:Domain of unknown function (DUF4314)